MKVEEIRQVYLSFFEERGHRIVPSASLVPSVDDPSVLLTTAGCNFFMGLPMGDDVMLNYQSTSFHDGAALRQLFGFRPAPEFEAWLEEIGVMRDGKLTARAGDPSVLS